MLVKAAWIVCLVLSLCLFAGSARGDTFTITFDRLEEIARERSPEGQILELEYRRISAERDESLQWSNPELAYDREDVDEFGEYQITLGKEFALPWVHLKRRSSWDARLKSVELHREQQFRNHLARLRTGYATVQLYSEYIEDLKQLKETLLKAARVSESRRQEGHLSGVEAHLIQMSVVSLSAMHQETHRLYDESVAAWRTALGYSRRDTLVLESRVGFETVELQDKEYYADRLESQPGLQAKTALQQAFSQRASAERLGFIPSISLYGGYKSIDPDLSGYVAGLSLNVPVFNQNSAAARKFEAESNIASYEAQLHHGLSLGRIESLLSSIAESRQLLTAVGNPSENDLQVLEGLLQSYEEGWMSLTELLNAIQIEVAGKQGYFKQLIGYYESLFELEALTGETLITF